MRSTIFFRNNIADHFGETSILSQLFKKTNHTYRKKGFMCYLKTLENKKVTELSSFSLLIENMWGPFCRLPAW